MAACPHCLEGGVGRIKDTRRHSVRCVREEERERVCGNSDCAGITAHLHDSSREDGGNHGVLLAPHQLCDLQQKATERRCSHMQAAQGGSRGAWS